MLGVSATAFETRAQKDSNIQHFFAAAAAAAEGSSSSSSAASSSVFTEGYSLSVEDVDEDVLASLPADIQEELKIRLSKRESRKSPLERAFAKASSSDSSSRSLQQLGAAPGTRLSSRSSTSSSDSNSRTCFADTVDTTNRLGYDPVVLRELPEDILNEVLSSNGRRHHLGRGAAAVPKKRREQNTGIQKFFSKKAKVS